MYHYCSMNNFFKIINSRKLFLFNANSMNDSLETNWILHLIDEEISKRKDIITDSDINLLRNSFRINRIYPYISCFSKNGDSLSQWRAYADDGKGIAIGFDQEKLRINNNIPSNTAVVKDSIGYFDCIYDIDIQKELINQNLDKICELIKQKNNTEMYFIDIAHSFNKLSLVFKNPCFNEEKECRIIHNPMVMGNKENDTIILAGISDIDFIVKGKNISSYFKFDLDDIFNSELIPVIILGPKNEMNLIELETYLSVKKLNNTLIKVSKASYR